MSNTVPWPVLTVHNVRSVYDPAACRGYAFLADGTVSKECIPSEEQRRECS